MSGDERAGLDARLRDVVSQYEDVQAKLATPEVSRDPETRAWIPAAELSGTWREPVLAMLREITQRTPGSLVEVKTAALAWHYRTRAPVSQHRRGHPVIEMGKRGVQAIRTCRSPPRCRTPSCELTFMPARSSPDRPRSER